MRFEPLQPSTALTLRPREIQTLEAFGHARLAIGERRSAMRRERERCLRVMRRDHAELIRGGAR